MPYYTHHVFVCTNRREDGEPCCGQFDPRGARTHLKQRVKKLGIKGPGQVRISSAGCLGRCELGPVIVVYPEGIWYTYVDHQDLDEIVDQHLVNGRPVKRLMI